MKKHYFQVLLLSALLFSYAIVAQQQFTNFDNELSIETIITQYPSQGICDGAFEVICMDGTAPYIYSIDAGNSFDSNAIFTGQCETKRFIHVRDANGKLGLAFLNLSSLINTPVYAEENIDSLKNVFLNSTNSVEKRNLQLKLTKLGVRYPAELVTLANNEYQIATLWDIHNLNNFIDRQETVFDDVTNVSIQNGNLIFTLPTFNQIKLENLAYILGYEGILLLNNE